MRLKYFSFFSRFITIKYATIFSILRHQPLPNDLPGVYGLIQNLYGLCSYQEDIIPDEECMAVSPEEALYNYKSRSTSRKRGFFSGLPCS